MIKSGGTPCLRAQAGRIGSIESIFKGLTRFLGWLTLLDFGEKGVYASILPYNWLVDLENAFWYRLLLEEVMYGTQTCCHSCC